MMPTVEFKDFKFTGTFEECAKWTLHMQNATAALPAPAAASRTVVATPVTGGRTVWPIPSSRLGVVSKPAVAAKPEGAFDVEATTLLFLAGIRDHRNTGGIIGEDVQKIVGVTHPKGVGSRLAMINQYLASRGFTPAEVYTKYRGSDGVRHWLAGRDLDDAIQSLEKGAGH